MDDHQTHEEIKKIQKDVQVRAQEESRQFPSPKKISKKIPSSFIQECLLINEVGDGMLYSELNRDKFLFVNNMNEWLAWNSHHWKKDDMKEAFIAVDLVAETYEKEANRLKNQTDDKSEKENGEESKPENKQKQEESSGQKYIIQSLNRRAKKLRGLTGRNNCLQFARACKNGLSIKGNELDINPWLLPCKNGVLDLRTGKLRNGRPADFLMRYCPTEYRDIDESSALWTRTLMEIFSNNQTLVDYLQRLLGYAIIGTNLEHIFPVFHGQGRNGKTMIVETISHVLGELAGPIQSSMLLDQSSVKSSSGPSPDIMALRGLRLAFASETDIGRRFSPSRVKWLTGGDTLVGRYPHDKYETIFKPTHTLFLLTNHRPHAPSDDFPFWERTHLIPFKISFVDRDPQNEDERPMDKTLPERLKIESSGILSWLIRGCLLYQKNGLTVPLVIREATAEYRREEDILADFIDEVCQLDPESEVYATELFDAFKEWYDNNVSKRTIPSQKRFGMAMTRKGFNREKVAGVYKYYGIKQV